MYWKLKKKEAKKIKFMKDRGQIMLYKAFLRSDNDYAEIELCSLGFLWTRISRFKHKLSPYI